MQPNSNYPKVPQAKISSLDINSLDAGLDERGEANIRANAFSVGTNAMVNNQGLSTHRLGLKRWLPDTVGPAYQVFPALYNDLVYYITADDSKIKYCLLNDNEWTDCGGDNVVTTDDTITTFLRVLDKVLIMNGEDNLGYVDLTNMEVVHFDLVASPTSVPTGAPTGITNSGAFKVYYCISYNSVVGKTASTPILSYTVSKIREQWASAGTEGVTVTDPNTRPSGAVSWNLYLATAPAGGTIQYSDMLPIALGLDINTTTFFDNGSITQLTNAGTAPDTNSTQGPKAKYGIQIENRPFLYGIKDDEYAVLIGGNDTSALDFTEGAGGYRLVLNQGTNYYPQSVIGFRTGTGLPSITVMFSNTEGLSKQSIIEQSTVSLGTFSATVWGSSEQNYGAAGVSSPYATLTYKGMLAFLTVDGLMKLNTQASLQNVLLPERISEPVGNYIDTIRTDMLPQAVATAWANRMFFSVASGGFTFNNKIVVYDTSRRDNECFYVFDLEAQWIGTVSPPGTPGFVYITQGNHFYRLANAYVAQDEKADGTVEPFPVEITTALIGGNTAHNYYYAIVQAVFYLLDFVGEVTLIVKWRDPITGNMKQKSKVVTNGEYIRSSVGNWSSPGNLFNQHMPTTVLRWGETDLMNDAVLSQKKSKRYAVPLGDVVTNELQATVLYSDNTGQIFRSVSFEGQGLGISPDLR